MTQQGTKGRQLRPFVFVAVAALVLSGCLGGTDAPDAAADGDVGESMPAASPVVQFVAVGDTGTGTEDQAAVAAGLETMCADLGCDFAIGLGDNIYDFGVTSPFDPQFEQKFEIPYLDLDFPWYMSLGNHDNWPDGKYHTAGDYQVMYHERAVRLSDKWQMPDRWYEHTQGHVQFVAMDTNLLPSSSPIYSDVGPVAGYDVDGVEQMGFLNETLNTPTDAPWRILYGHHPLHFFLVGNEKERPVDRWLYEAQCGLGPVDVVFSGHDHILRWRKAAPDRCGPTEFITSGAGAKTDPYSFNASKEHFAVGDQLGFWWIEIVGDTFTGKAYDENAELLFERSFTRNATVSL